MRITIETDHDGHQLRSYGPEVWSGTVKVEKFDAAGEPYPWEGLDPRIVQQYLRAVTFFTVEHEWPRPHLKRLEETEPGLWEYRIEAEFVD